MPGERTSPGRERQYPCQVPRVQDRRKNDCGAKRPKHSALPISRERERGDCGDDDDHQIITIMLLMPVRPNRIIQNPPEYIVQPANWGEVAEQIRWSNT